MNNNIQRANPIVSPHLPKHFVVSDIVPLLVKMGSGDEDADVRQAAVRVLGDYCK